jgi:hypothetical protein
MEAHLKSQILTALRYAPPALCALPFKKKSSAQTRAIRAREGGTLMRGVCRAPDTGDYALLRAGGFRWLRGGICPPFDKEGNLTARYRKEKERLRLAAENGFKIMVITPTPGWFLDLGIDSRTPDGARRLAEIAQFFMRDLRGIIHAVQIGNELSIPRFARDYTLAQAADYIGIQAKAMAAEKGDILVGYNLIGPQVDLNVLMRPYMDFVDYVGVDIYLGSFFKAARQIWLHDLICAFLWSFTGKPIIICETGYLGGGAPKTAAEKKEILAAYGFADERAVRENPEAFLAKLPQTGRDYAKRCASGDLGDFLLSLDFKNHIYAQVPQGAMLKGCPHTPAGQAAFYKKLLPRLEKLPFLCGVFVYTWRDDAVCSICGQESCPLETRWGICTRDGAPKPAYDAIRDIWGAEKHGFESGGAKRT